ncbi:MAG: HEAT repeat domain-containing protein, partial [Planctomycetota bacterium]
MFTYVQKKTIVGTGLQGATTVDPKVEKLISVLLKNLEDKYFDVRAASAIALGKLGRNTPRIRAKLEGLLKDKNRDVKESAALALGMIRAVESTGALTNVVRIKRNKRGFRCVSAVALGLMGNPANQRLLEYVYNAPDSKPEVKAGCLLGLGLLRDERAAYTLYKAILGNVDEALQSFAVTSLAKIGKTELTFPIGRQYRKVDVVKLFEQRLLRRRTKPNVRRAMAMALGTIGRENTSIHALLQAYRLDQDKGVKGFSLLSLALMKKSDANKVVVRDVLLRALKREGDATVRGFLALAVGLTQDQETGSALLEVFNKDGNPEVRAAAAVGLGVLQYRPALPHLGKEVARPKDRGDARGYACVALGLIGDPAASK